MPMCMLEQLTDIGGVTTGWRYTEPVGSVELYDADGLLQLITDIRGNTKALSYDAQSRLERVDSNSGEYQIFTYDAQNRLNSVSDSSTPVRTWAFRYDANGNLEYVDNPDGTSRQYHYNEPAFTSGADLPHALTGITDERGVRYATWEYAANGRAKASYHADDVQRVDIIYNTDHTRTVTNSKGSQSTYGVEVQLGVPLVTDVSGPGCSSCGSGNASYQYDPTTNDLLTETDNGVTTQYGNYDAKGQYSYKIEAAGTAEAQRTDMTYDPRFSQKVTTETAASVYTP